MHDALVDRLSRGPVDTRHPLQGRLWVACIDQDVPIGAEERHQGVVSAVECPVGCRGTTGCLCGQGELSDDPVWIEND